MPMHARAGFRSLRHRAAFRAAMAALAFAVVPPACRAEIAPGSVLAIDVWQHPELSHESTVREDGRIEFPPVGEVRVQGLAPAAIAQRIGDGLGGYMREPAYVTVREVFPVSVTGFVAQPGRVVLERAPTLLEAILQCGGPTPGAWLDRVMIYRPGKPGTTGEIQVASVAEAFARGQGAATPELRRGDLVFVRGESPGAGGAGAGAAGAAGGAASAAAGVSRGMVLLEGVARAGLYPIPDGADLFTALALAGGAAPTADISRTRVLSLQGDRRVVYEVDLKTLKAGAAPQPFLLRDGDVVQVGGAQGGFLSRTWRGTRDVLTLSTSIASAYLLIHQINN